MPKRRRDLSVPSDSVPILNEKLGQLSSIAQHLTDQGLLDADAVNGVLSETVGGTGESTYANGELLIGNGTTKGLDRATLTAGSNVTITNGPGTVQIASSGSGDVSSDTSVSVDGEVALFKSTTGKVIKRATGTGFAKLTSGVLSTAASIVESNLFLTNNTTADSTGVQHGLLPRLSGSGSDVLRGDGTWGAAAGLSNVTNDAQTKAAVVPNTAPSSGQILVGNAGGTAYAPQSMSSDATIASTGALTIANGAVTLAKQANMATASVVYRKTAGSGAPEVNTLATLKTDLGLTGTNSGDQTVVLTGDVTGSGTGSFATTIAANAVTLAKMDATNGTANRVLMSGAVASPTWSVPTYPNASATSGKTIRSDGTNWIASTATLSDAPGTAGKVLLSDGTNWIPSTPTFPNASATAGKFIRSDGTNWAASSSTIPDTFTKGDVLAATTNALTAVSVGADGLVLTADTASTPGVKWSAAGKTTQLNGGTNTVNVTANTTSFWAAAANGTGATTTQQTSDVSGGTRSTLCKAGTLKNLFVTCGAAAGSGKTTTFTVLKNGVSTGITCTVSGVSQVTNSDTTHTASVVAGDEITMQIATQTGYTASKMAWGLECEITAGGTGHALLSSTHTDTTAAAVVRGDIITGQTATPLWQRLALGSAGKILRSDGTDLSYTTATYPATTTANQLLYSSSANTIAEITAAASSILVTDASNVPSLVSTAWVTRVFAAGNFSANGSMTWAVASGNVTTDAYLQIGKTMVYAFKLANTSVGGTPNTFLQITLPNGVTAKKTMDFPCRIVDAGTASIGWCEVGAASTTLLIVRADGANWASSSGLTQASGVITLEIT